VSQESAFFRHSHDDHEFRRILDFGDYYSAILTTENGSWLFSHLWGVERLHTPVDIG
jgi:hypothetical protein